MGASAIFCKEARTGAVLRVLLVPDGQTVAVEVEDLDSISAAVEKQEEMTGQEFLAEALLNQTGKAIEALA
jgi:hypothetical protein